MKKLKGADLKFKQLSVHVSAIRTAARSLSTWLEDDIVGSEDVEVVKRDLAEVLYACCDLLSDLQDLLAKALAGAESVGFKGMVRYVWNEETIKETTELLHHQETALLLMLQALSQMRSSEQRQAKLREPSAAEVLQKAKRPSSSIFGLNGGSRSSQQLSFESESSAKLEDVFTFDMEVMASTAYRNAFTSLLRRNITKRTEELANTGANRDSMLTLKPADTGPEVDEVEGTIGVAVSSENRVETKSQENATPPLIKPKLPPKPAANDKIHAPIYGSTKGCFVRALYDYEADDITSLSFHQGDMIQVITQLESGWWDGVINGVRGWFPSNYCVIVHNNDVDNVDDDDDSDDLTSVDYDEDDRNKSKESGRDEEGAFWIPQATQDGRLFYFNTLTGVSTMALPLGKNYW